MKAAWKRGKIGLFIFKTAGAFSIKLGFVQSTTICDRARGAMRKVNKWPKRMWLMFDQSRDLDWSISVNSIFQKVTREFVIECDLSLTNQAAQVSPFYNSNRNLDRSVINACSIQVDWSTYCRSSSEKVFSNIHSKCDNKQIKNHQTYYVW